MNTINQQASFQEDYKKYKSRAKVMTVITGFAVVICIIFLLFAFIQKAEAEKAKSSVVDMKLFADEQQRAAAKQSEAMAQQIQSLEKMLKECNSK